jgi:hypothetical protein
VSRAARRGREARTRGALRNWKAYTDRWSLQESKKNNEKRRQYTRKGVILKKKRRGRTGASILALMVQCEAEEEVDKHQCPKRDPAHGLLVDVYVGHTLMEA